MKEKIDGEILVELNKEVEFLVKNQLQLMQMSYNNTNKHFPKLEQGISMKQFTETFLKRLFETLDHIPRLFEAQFNQWRSPSLSP